MKMPVRRYADALFSAVGGLEANEAALADLSAVRVALQEVPRARQVLAHPTVRPEMAAYLMDALAAKCSPAVARFLRLLAERGRLRHLDEVVEAYRRRVEQARGVTRARLQSARGLPAEQVEGLRAMLARRFGAVELTTEVRPELLGGARVVVGDHVLDGSIAAHLQRLRRALIAARD